MYQGIDRMEQIISGLSAHQKLISNNIANAQTPGYSRQEMSFSSVLGDLQNPFETELSQKMGTIRDAGVVDGGEPVDLAHEMIDMQKVFLNYTMVTRRATTVFSNIRRATQIGR